MVRYISDGLRSLAALIIVAGMAGCILNSKEDASVNRNCTSGWTITSYWISDEKFYEGPKIEARDQDGTVIGHYKSDFLEQVRINALGKGDGVRNNGGIINYNFYGETYRLLGFPQDFYGGRMKEWETVAANPPLPRNTRVKIQSLGNGNAADWVEEKLLSNIFYARDIMGVSGKWIDIFVGMQDAAEENGSYNSAEVFKFEDATVCISN